MEQPTTMDEVVDGLKKTVARIGADLGPDEDWVPVMIFFGDRPGIIAIPFLGDPETKNIVAQKVIPGLIEQAKPDFVGLVTMGWMKSYDQSSIEGRAEQARDEAKFEPGNIADRPGKSECLCIHIVGKDGVEHQLMAHVHRYPTVSPLLEWFVDTADDGIPKGGSAGRFPDALRAGMEAAWKT